MKRFLSTVLLSLSVLFLGCNSAPEKNSAVINSNAQPSVNEPVINAAAMENSLKNDSTNIDLRIKLAASYYSSGELDKAAFHFMKVYQQDPANLTALTSLGNIFYDGQQSDNAILFYEKALAIDSTNIDVRCDLATSYSNINKMKKAIQILKENIKANPSHAKSHHNLAVILKKNGNMEEADKEMAIYKSLSGGPN